MLPSRCLPLFGATVRREAGELLTLNLLMLLASLPLITAPAAFVAGARISLDMAADRPRYLWRDFWRGFGAVVLRATGVALLLMLALLAAGWSTWIWAQMIAARPLAAAPASVSACVTLAIAAVGLRALILVAAERNARLGLWRRAALASLAAPGRSLAGLAAFAAAPGLTLLFYPLSVLPGLIMTFSLGTLAATIALRPADTARRAGRPSQTVEEETTP
ncbi:hypothetical protein [Pelagovum pacificum]|nr:hypothetical protein [Pelagovum pacificum]QQA43387.1 hypothetical protein I8N54_02095 [Pelagovum pacificum]